MSEELSRIAAAFQSFEAPRGRGNKLHGFRKSMPYNFLSEFDDLVARAKFQCSHSSSSTYSKLRKFLVELEEILPESHEQK